MKTGAQVVKRRLGLFLLACGLKQCRSEASAGAHYEGGDMRRVCTKCGGLLIGELAMDFYQAKSWKCVNCGWYREETLVRPGRPILPVHHRAYR